MLPPIRDILPGYLHDGPQHHSNSPSPPLSSHPRTPSNSSSPHLAIADPQQSPIELSARGIPYSSAHDAGRGRSISSFIPTPSFQFASNGGSKSSHSPPSISQLQTAETPVKRGTKRTRSPQSEPYPEPDHSTTSQHSESDDESRSTSGGKAPAKKRRREEKKHACPYCKKLFHRPVSLGVHINTHTGEKPYTCPFPNCSREFNVNSNMRRHYRTHFAPGTVDMNELTYSSADERFYIHATNPTPPNPTRGRYGQIPPYLPPVPSVSYGVPSPSGPEPGGHSYNPSHHTPYGGGSYVPIVYHQRSAMVPLHSHGGDQLLHQHEQEQKQLAVVGRLKPASNWNRGSRPHPDSDEDDDSDAEPHRS